MTIESFSIENEQNGGGNGEEDPFFAKKKPEHPIDANPFVFRPYPPIQNEDEIWRPPFPKPLLPDTATPAERAKAYRVDHFDYKNAMAREKLIFEEETQIWAMKFQKCKEVSGMNNNTACKQLGEILDERNAYINSRYSKYRMPTLSPSLPDLGPLPADLYNGAQREKGGSLNN